jgi:hypothetical protein
MSSNYLDSLSSSSFRGLEFVGSRPMLATTSRPGVPPTSEQAVCVLRACWQDSLGMSWRVPRDDHAGERVTESGEERALRLGRELQLDRRVLLVGVIAAAVLVPLWIFALPSDNWAVDLVAMVVVFAAVGGLTVGPALYLGAWWELRALSRPPAARIVRRDDR